MSESLRVSLRDGRPCVEAWPDTLWLCPEPLPHDVYRWVSDDGERVTFWAGNGSAVYVWLDERHPHVPLRKAARLWCAGGEQCD